jgi:hypothetical protein
LLPRVITTPPLRLISATTYGEAFAELRYEVPLAQCDNNPESEIPVEDAPLTLEERLARFDPTQHGGEAHGDR